MDAWGFELAKVGEEPNRSQTALQHVLLEDIINGRLDHTGPLQDGRKRGLHLEFGGRAYFVEGHEIRTLMASDPSLSLHRILIMKEAVLDFAKRREIPPPSWWTDVSTDAGVTTKGTHSIAASPIPAPTHSAGPRGRRPKKLDQVKEAMREDIRRGQKTPGGLRDMLDIREYTEGS